MMRTLLTAALAAALGLALVGCGSDPGGTKVDPNAAATSKVDAAKQIAAAVATDPNSDEAFGALENFRNIPMEPKKHPAESKEILDIYKSQIESKLKKGEISDQIRTEFLAFKGQLEKG